MESSASSSLELLRHTVATVAYRGGKALRGALEIFAKFKLGEKSRTPEQILAPGFRSRPVTRSRRSHDSFVNGQ